MPVSLIYRDFLDSWPDLTNYLAANMRFLQTYHANYVTGRLPDPAAVVADYRKVWTEQMVAALQERVRGRDVAALVRHGLDRTAALLDPREEPEVICFAGLWASNANQYLIAGRPVVGIGMEIWGGAIAQFPCPWEDLPLLVSHECGHATRYAEGDCRLAAVARPDYILPRAWSEVPLLEFIVDEGLAQVVSAASFPEADEPTVLLTPPEQVRWWEENFDSLWQGAVPGLHEPPGLQTYIKYFSVGADGLPPRTGYYLGWRVVRRFLERNPHVSIAAALRMPAEAFLP